MREIQVSQITETVKKLCIEANHFLSKDMEDALINAQQAEESELGKKIFAQLRENLDIAGKDMIPICQDTGMAVLFVKVGQEVHFVGGNLTDAINEGVREGYDLSISVSIYYKGITRRLSISCSVIVA